MECAAAGAALVLSDVAAFPEVFGEGATIVPMVGKYIPELERRVTPGDYVDIVVELMTNPEVWLAASQKARALAEQNTWGKCIDRWEQMLEQLGERVS
jgi:glycosyltransferase involved in cell wall biosynthesis